MLSLNRVPAVSRLGDCCRRSGARANAVGCRPRSDPRRTRRRPGRRLEPRLRRYGADQGPAAARALALARLRQPRSARPLSRHRRVHRQAPRLAASEGVAQARRGSAGGRVGRGRCRLAEALPPAQRGGPGPRRRDRAEFRRRRDRHRGVAGGLGRGRFQRARREGFSRPALGGDSTAGRRAAARPPAVGRADRSGAAHAGAGAARLPRARRGASGARPASPGRRAPRRPRPGPAARRFRASSTRSCAGGGKRT